MRKMIASEEGVTDDINMGRFFINMGRSFELYNINIFCKFLDYVI